MVFLPCSEFATSKIDQLKKYFKSAKAMMINTIQPTKPRCLFMAKVY